MNSCIKRAAPIVCAGLLFSACTMPNDTPVPGASEKTSIGFASYLADIQKAMPTKTSAGKSILSKTLLQASAGVFPSNTLMYDVWTATNVPTPPWEPNFSSPSGDNSIVNSIFGMAFPKDGSIYGEIAGLDSELARLNQEVANDNTAMMENGATILAMPNGAQLPIPMGDVVTVYLTDGTPVWSSGGIIFKNGYDIQFTYLDGSSSVSEHFAYYRASNIQSIAFVNNTDTGAVPHHIYYGLKKTMANGDL